ncbi:hypothetical protein GCM10009543_22840 [Leifsonia naganoensis]
MAIPWGSDKRRVSGYVLDSQRIALRVFLPGTDGAGRLRRWQSLASEEVVGTTWWRDLVESRDDVPASEAIDPATGTIDGATATALSNSLRDLVGDVDVRVARWRGYVGDATPASGPPDGEHAVTTEPLAAVFTPARPLPSFVWIPEAWLSVGAPLYADSVFVSGPEESLAAIARNPELESAALLADQPLPLPGLE